MADFPVVSNRVATFGTVRIVSMSALTKSDFNDHPATLKRFYQQPKTGKTAFITGYDFTETGVAEKLEEQEKREVLLINEANVIGAADYILTQTRATSIVMSLEVAGEEASASGLSFMLAVFAAIHGFPQEHLYTGTSILTNGGLSASQLGDVSAKTLVAKHMNRILVL